MCRRAVLIRSDPLLPRLRGSEWQGEDESGTVVQFALRGDRASMGQRDVLAEF